MKPKMKKGPQNAFSRKNLAWEKMVSYLTRHDFPGRAVVRREEESEFAFCPPLFLPHLNHFHNNNRYGKTSWFHELQCFQFLAILRKMAISRNWSSAAGIFHDFFSMKENFRKKIEWKQISWKKYSKKRKIPWKNIDSRKRKFAGKTYSMKENSMVVATEWENENSKTGLFQERSLHDWKFQPNLT